MAAPSRQMAALTHIVAVRPPTKAERTAYSSDTEPYCAATAMPVATLRPSVSASSAGRPVGSPARYAALSSAPRTAMPATLPICRRTWTSAEPAAARSRGSAASAPFCPQKSAPPTPAPTRTVHPDPGAEQEPQRPDDETAYPEHPRPEARQQHHRQPKPDEEAQHHRYRSQARTERVLAEDAAQVLRHDEHRAEEREAGDRRRQGAPPERRLPPQQRVDHRLDNAFASLPPHERPERRRTTDQSGQHQRIGPPALRPLDDAVRRREHPDGGEEYADQVQPATSGTDRLGQEQQDSDQGERDDWQVDDEHRTPPEVLEQHARHDRPQRQPDHRRDAQRRDRPSALLGLEQHDDRRHREWDEDRGTDPEQRPGGDETLGARRQRAPERAEEEQDQPDHRRALPSVPVAEHSGGQQQRTQSQQVAVREPLELRAGRVEAHGDVGQRDVEDRRVEPDDENGRRGGGERPPPARVGDNPRLTNV